MNGLSENPSIRITSPDKGNGVAIMNKTDYTSKTLKILSDTTKFGIVHDPEDLLIRKLESKLNTFLGKLKSKKIINETQYKQIYASGSNVGAMYGLAKTHKDDVPLRPIVQIPFKKPSAEKAPPL